MTGEGKTTTVANLGVSILREGKRVVIVDLDLRRPRQHQIWQRQNNLGISSVLTGQATLDEAIQKTDIDDISLLTTGPVPPDPGGMIESQVMKNMIEDLSARFDAVLLDTPPESVSNDAIIAASYADATVLVLKPGMVPFKTLHHALNNFHQGGITISGIVMNNVKGGAGSYYYNTSYYYNKA